MRKNTPNPISGSLNALLREAGFVDLFLDGHINLLFYSKKQEGVMLGYRCICKKGTDSGTSVIFKQQEHQIHSHNSRKKCISIHETFIESLLRSRHLDTGNLKIQPSALVSRLPELSAGFPRSQGAEQSLEVH